MTNEIITGDSMEQLDELDENSVHAIVTDPPYGLAFMGKSWDDFEPKEYQQWCETWARKAQRVLKPGGHMLAFSGNRTHHRLFSGVEDAGYEIRDTITWHYGSGFPKALDVSKSIDKRNNAERKDLGPNPNAVGRSHNKTGGDYNNDHEENRSQQDRITAPATDAAEKWDGFKTALKPATEYLVVARKPFDGTVAENIQEHGTGALNIDSCRIETNDGESLDGGRTSKEWYGKENEHEGYDRPCNHRDEWAENTADEYKQKVEKAEQEGRYPSNVIFDETQAHALDSKNEHSDGTIRKPTGEKLHGGNALQDSKTKDTTVRGFDDSGGPSRYFYTSKATRAERTLDGKIENAHPTVKPTDLMEWLVTLVTAEGQTVLDPFIGSGTTGMACKNKNRQFIGIERNKEYADIARVRCGLTPDDPSVVREHENQNGLEQYS